MVRHNGKNRIVFNCSFQYQGQSLNVPPIPGPILGPSLLGVLLWFRQHSVAISADVKGMFHQVHFLWRNMHRTEQPEIYEWQVLPFGTKCSPCCAIYALQRVAHDNSETDPTLAESVLQSFYVDNCLQSAQSTEKARALVDGLRQLLLTEGINLCQWASNKPEAFEHLPTEARTQSSALWLSQ